MGNCFNSGCGGFDLDMILWVLIIIVIVTCCCGNDNNNSICGC